MGSMVDGQFIAALILVISMHLVDVMTVVEKKDVGSASNLPADAGAVAG